jgi:hypothetical protein
MKKHIGTIALFGIPLLLVSGLIVLIIYSPASNGPTESGRASRELVMSCTTDMATTFHIHPMLKVFINGEEQTILEDIGIDAGNCMHPVHTHDATGKIHVESPVKKDFTLGDFFMVWDKTFNGNQILDSVADDTHRIRMTVNGADSTEYENLVLKDLDQIEIRYEEFPQAE